MCFSSDSKGLLSMNEKGFAQIILVVVLLGFVVAILIAFVVGLEQVHQSSSSKSLFSDDAKIKPILENFNEKKKEILSGVSEIKDRFENEQTKDTTFAKGTRANDERVNDLGFKDRYEDGQADTQKAPKERRTTGDRLSDLEGRLSSEDH